jgi:hypothetical protein
VILRSERTAGEQALMASPVRMSEMIASHAVLDHEMTDHRLDGGTPPRLAFDLWRDAPLLTCGEDSQLIIGRRVVAAMSGIGDDAIERIADKRLHGSGMTIASTWPLSPRITLAPEEIARLGSVKLAGMAAEAFVHTRERTRFPI